MDSTRICVEEYKLPPPSRLPFLLYSHGKGCTKSTLCTLPLASSTSSLEKFRASSTLKKLKRREVVASFPNGWILLYHKNKKDNHQYHYALWNAATLKFIDLPPLTFQRKRISASVLSEDLDCKLFLFRQEVKTLFFCRPFHANPQWIKIQYGEEMKRLFRINSDYFLSQPVSSDGKLYATGDEHSELLKVDILENTTNNRIVISKVCEMPIPQRRVALWQNWLVGSDKDLFTISMAKGGITSYANINIEVSKLDFSSRSWVQVDSVGEHAFFLCCNFTGYILSSRHQDLKNHIYFTQDAKYLYSYDIERRSLSVTHLCPDIHSQLPPPVWVMPSGDLEEEKSFMPGHFEELREENMLANPENVVDSDAERKISKTKEIILSDLFLGVLNLVSQKLTPADYLNFRAVCKTFLSAAPLIQWRNLFLHSIVTFDYNYLPPWLIFSTKNRGKEILNFVNPNHNEKYHISVPESELLLDGLVMGSKGGWLLVSKSQKSIVLFNPFTKEIKELADLGGLPAHVPGVAFTSSSPTSKECLILGCLSVEQLCWIYVMSPGKEGWNCVSRQYDHFFTTYHVSPVFMQGDFYFLGIDGRMGVVKVDGDDEDCYNLEVLDKLASPCNASVENYLVDCGGELVSVFVGFNGSWVRVFRLDFSRLAWVEVDSLENRSIFVSPSSSFSVLCESRGIKSRIYFPRHYQEHIVFYSLETGKFHAVDSEFSSKDYQGTREQLLSSWIQPRW